MYTKEKILTTILDIFLYWPVVIWEAFIKTFKIGLGLLLSSYSFLLIFAALTAFIKGEGFSLIFPNYFWDVFKIILLGLFLILIINITAFNHRRYLNQVEPFRYLKVTKHNATKKGQSGIGIQIKNYNQGEVFKVHGTIRQVSKDTEPFNFPETNLFYPSVRIGERELAEYTTEYNIKPFQKLFIEIAYQKPDGTSYWRTISDNILEQLPPIVQDSKYTIILRVNLYRTAGGQFIYHEYEIEMGYISNILKIKRISKVD